MKLDRSKAFISHKNYVLAEIKASKNEYSPHRLHTRGGSVECALQFLKDLMEAKRDHEIFIIRLLFYALAVFLRVCCGSHSHFSVMIFVCLFQTHNRGSVCTMARTKKTLSAGKPISGEKPLDNTIGFR